MLGERLALHELRDLLIKIECCVRRNRIRAHVFLFLPIVGSGKAISGRPNPKLDGSCVFFDMRGARVREEARGGFY